MQQGKLDVFRTPSGYSGADIAEYGQPGSNGLTLDPQGRLTINQHGNHRVVRDEKDGTQTVLADSYEGKRLNSPNDLVYRSDGTLFFTDPPFGFPKFFDDPRKQLPFSGVFSIYKGKLQLVSKDFTGPNGIAFLAGRKVSVRRQLAARNYGSASARWRRACQRDWREAQSDHALRSAGRRNVEEWKTLL